MVELLYVLDMQGHADSRIGDPPEEDKVTLVVEGDDPAPAESRILAEQGRKHAAHPPPQPSPKIIQHQLWLVGCCSAMPLEPTHAMHDPVLMRP